MFEQSRCTDDVGNSVLVVVWWFTYIVKFKQFVEYKMHVFLFRLLAAVMEGCSIDGFHGKLQLVSVGDIQRVHALESQSMNSYNVYW